MAYREDEGSLKADEAALPEVDLAKAIYDALRASDRAAFIGRFSVRDPVTFDGEIDLLEVARFLANALSLETSKYQEDART
ncbi:hypothetical protein [Aurantimonas coralicida]|uniref:hypothetical protein n=1 Tax=Aurantimonas coralicida TaxID=182270 RepID=UPI00238919E2|nr:hypothetical protein [Aurantimonas coralicida]MDE0921519.1 hypothetical protein [Aurantimonas coralicida]